jgi:hypothetical protein
MTVHTFAARLGLDDMFRHITHDFEVPAGTRSIIVEYDVEPFHPGIGPLTHQVSLSLDGPNGSRGAQHKLPWLDGTRRVISETWSSNGYTPGAIEPGTWTLSVDVFRIMPPGNTSYEVTVTLSDQAADGPALPMPVPVADRGPGWYKGDLHGHTDHSDGNWTVAEFLQHARNRGLDFVTITDHNTTSGQPWAMALADDDLLVMCGIEVTTLFGHCLALGARRWVDWRIKDGDTMTDRANAIMAAGHTFVIAHPMAEGHPWCAGCHWQFADVFPGPARLVEIWNGPWDPAKNELGLRLFQVWLNSGVRMRATAGTDIHGPQGSEVRVGYNRVRAEAFTEEAILAGIRAGQNVLTNGPVLNLAARSGSATAGVGEELASGSAVDLVLDWADVPPGSRLTIFTGGEEGTMVRHETSAEGAGSLAHGLGDLASRNWVMATLRCNKGDMLAITNPVFVAGDWR